MESNMTKRFKIEPDLTCPELAGYKLPPCSRCQEDGVEAMAKNEYEQAVKRKGQEYAGGYYEGTIDGYNKAREKFEFTESDLRQAVALSLDDAEKSVIWSKEWYPNKLADKIIAFLRTPRIPIAIEVEMDSTKSLLGVWTGFIPATNPDGTVKGVYVYE